MGSERIHLKELDKYTLKAIPWLSYANHTLMWDMVIEVLSLLSLTINCSTTVPLEPLIRYASGHHSSDRRADARHHEA